MVTIWSLCGAADSCRFFWGKTLAASPRSMGLSLSNYGCACPSMPKRSANRQAAAGLVELLWLSCLYPKIVTLSIWTMDFLQTH